MMRKPTNDLKVMVYRGVQVYLTANSSPRFWAEAGGQHFWGGSWDTLRKKLDGAVAFEPFDALMLTRDGIEQVRVTGLDLEDSQWVVAGGGDRSGGTRIKFYSPIYPLTMRDKLEGWLAECENWEKIESDIAAARSAMREGLEAEKLPNPVP